MVMCANEVTTCPSIILFLAKHRTARFIISSRAKRACTTQASQGQRDFLLAINLSSLVGVRLDVIQSSDVKCIMGFQATDCNRRTRGSQWGGGFYGYRLKFCLFLITAIG